MEYLFCSPDRKAAESGGQGGKKVQAMVRMDRTIAAFKNGATE
jgi:hypothetical protein